MEQGTKRSKNQNEEDSLKKQSEGNPLKKGFVWRPVPTITSTTLCFLISGVIFIVVGAVLLYYTTQIKEFVIRYDNLADCDNALRNAENKTCMIDVNLEDEFEPPVMVYYQLENFYQVHRRYIKSKSIDQLKGKVLTVADITSDCDPVITVEDLGVYKTIGNYTLKSTDPANPCGLIARSLFNDTYSLIQNNASIYINDTNIAWDSDKNGRYTKPKNASMIQWTDVENEHFMVWMRPAGLPDFRKLWGRINKKLQPGKYKLQITNNYQVSSFGGKKSFVLSTANILGGKNNFLGIAYLVVGCICVIMALLFWVGYKSYNSDKKFN
jgi:hypothetical protein